MTVVKRGRPVEFDPQQAIDLMNAEIEAFNRGEIQVYEVLDLGDGKQKLVGKPYMSLGTVALMCGVCSETLRNHAKNHLELAETIEKFKAMGKALLIRGGLMGVYHPNIVQFIGNCVYGLIPTTRQQQEHEIEIKSMDEVYAELDAIYAKQEARLTQQKAEMEERKRMLDAMGEEES